MAPVVVYDGARRCEQERAALLIQIPCARPFPPFWEVSALVPLYHHRHSAMFVFYMSPAFLNTVVVMYSTFCTMSTSFICSSIAACTAM